MLRRLPLHLIASTIVGLSLLIFSLPIVAIGQENDDSLFILPHERFFERHYPQPPVRIPTLKEPRLLPSGTPFPNVNISGDTAPQNEPSVRISHKDPNIAIAAWRDFRTGVNPAIRRIGYSFTTDGGVTWSPSDLLPRLVDGTGYHRMSDPAVCVDTGGHFYIATIAVDDNDSRGKILVYRQNELIFFDQSFFAPLDTAVNFFDDKEYIVCDLSPISPHVNTLYISWTGFRGTGGGMLMTSSTDQGETWSHSVIINDAGNSGQGSDPCVRLNGDVCVVWAGGSGIMFDKSTNGGASFGTDKVVSSAPGGGGGLAGFPAIATDLSGGVRSGYLYTIWADQRNGDLDVFLSTSSDGGATWSSAHRVNDDSLGNGMQQFWPWIAVDDRGIISIVYYDTRLTGDNSITYTFLAHSWDGGATFTNRLISTAQSPRNTPNGAVRYGDYIGLDSWAKHTISVWTDERAGGFDMEIYTAVMDTLPRSNFATVSVRVRNGWNMVSVPVTGIVGVAQYLFPPATPPAFVYTRTYEPRDTLEVGNGYWLRFPSVPLGSIDTLEISGDSLLSDTIDVVEGWNMIGSITTQIATANVTSDPPGMITSAFFPYEGSYNSSPTINPGQGYWVKVNGSGKLILSSNPGIGPSARIHIVATNELPPSSPDVDSHAASRSPDQFHLGQNYPNPFNPITIIRYAIAEHSTVSLRVYDIFGRNVATLANGVKDPGEYEATWDARAFPSGVYAYRLQVVPGPDGSSTLTGSFADVRKMLLVK